MISLSPATHADLRRCVARWGLSAVLEGVRTRRAWPQFGGYPEPICQAPGPLAVLLAQECRLQVRQVVRRLPLLEKRVVRLHYWRGVGLGQMRPVLGLSVTVALAVHRSALGRLKSMLIEEWLRGAWE